MAFGSTLWKGTKSIGSGIGNALWQNLGNIDKAIIEIADFSKREIQENNAQKPGGGTGISGLKGLDGFDADLVTGYAKTLKAAAGKLANAAGGDDNAFDINKDFQRFRFEVPFNPAELTITGYGGEEMMVSNYANRTDKQDKPDEKQGDGKPPERSNAIKVVAPHIEMIIPLIFDKTNNQDAFYGDKFTLGSTNLVRGGMNLAKGIAGKDDYSVQKEVESFTYILRNHQMKLMRFTWGDMSYQGVLNGVNAEYTMFNVNGEPCRATVSLRLVILDGDYPDQTRIIMNRYKQDIGFNEQKAAVLSGRNLTGLH
jgi:hypothetical protein